MNWRKVTFVVVSLIFLLGGSAALSWLFVSLKPEPPRKPDMNLKRFVKAETVKYGDVVSEVIATGRVVSGHEVSLVAEASGKIEPGKVSLREGASFRKGQLLATIYKDETELALKARKSRFLNTFTLILPDLKIDFNEYYEPFMSFFKAMDIAEKLPEFPEYVDEKLKIYLSSKGILSEYYGIKQDELRLDRHSLYAPFNGTFTQVNFEPGAYINMGGQIAKMIRTDMLEIEVPVENGQSAWIKIGDKAKVYPRDRQHVYDGTVVRKSNFVDPATQSRSIFVRVTNGFSRELLAGEYKLAEFTGQVIPGAMEIPRGAVFNSNEVFVVLDGKLKKEVINILKWNEKTLIFNGLDEGMKVVTEPLINVKENSLVGIQGEEMAVAPQSGRQNRGGSPNREE